VMAPEWTKDELGEQIICFVIETDQVCISSLNLIITVSSDQTLGTFHC